VCFELQTPRLRLIALDLPNLRLSLDEPRRMEANLSLQAGTSVPAGEIRKAIEEMLAGVLQDPASWLWYTHWQIVLRQENRIIGGLCFKGPPDQSGEVEVGYGLEPAYHGRGYMSEALRASVKWALEQPDVAAVISETVTSNAASQRVLKKSGFVLYEETDQYLWWRYPSD
jgi:ribosomal-protein-alanine N-acetyltransferase